MHPMLLIATLLLQPPAAPPGTSRQPRQHDGPWQVETIDNIKVLPDSHVTIQIQGGNIAGAAPCNTYRGQIQIDGSRFTVGELLRTMKTCDQLRMNEETDFFRVLGAAVRLEFPNDDALLLVTGDGRRITARRK